MTYPASLIAYAFVLKGISEGNPVTQMKLQKIVYFAQGVHLNLFDKPLVREVFQAWKFGPVIPDIYRIFKFYGSKPITDTDYLFSIDDYSSNISNLDSGAREAIDMTWDATKDINAIQLSNWTHEPESPWAKHYAEGTSDSVIPNEEIKEYFKSIMEPSGDQPESK
jgi:uncharacterized phage-associated protein